MFLCALVCFGVALDPFVSQKTMHTILCDCKGVLDCIDDIIVVYDHTREDHGRSLR